GDLGGPAADVDDEAALPPVQVQASARGGGDRLVDELHGVPGTTGAQDGEDGAALDPGGAGWHADQRARAQQAIARAGLVQERVQHLRGRVEVGDHAVAQRVDDPDVLRLLVRQIISGDANGGDCPGRRVHGDGG